MDKRLLARCLSSWLLLLAGCDTFDCTLTATKGTGNGEYALTQIVAIKADDPAFNYAFDRWIGDVDGIADVTESETTIMIRAGNSTIEATYRLVACTLEVVNGSGSGTYTPAQAVTIRANTPPSGQVFNGWAGDVSGVADVKQAETTIVVNQAHIRIEATYRGGPTSAPSPSGSLPPPSSYRYVTGDKRDKGGELWKTSYQGMQVRLSANDVSNLQRNGVPATGSWYPLDAAVAGSAVSLSVASDGGIIASASDFVSPRTGLKYHFCGFLVHTSSSTLQQVPSITIPRDQCHDALRFMFATVAQ